MAKEHENVRKPEHPSATCKNNNGISATRCVAWNHAQGHLRKKLGKEDVFPLVGLINKGSVIRMRSRTRGVLAAVPNSQDGDAPKPVGRTRCSTNVIWHLTRLCDLTKPSRRPAILAGPIACARSGSKSHALDAVEALESLGSGRRGDDAS